MREVKVTRCVLCKAKLRCVLMEGTLVHSPGDFYVPCKDPEARGNKPTRVRRK